MKLTRQLIPDNEFRGGFIIRSQKDHTKNNAICDFGVFPSGSTNPCWLIAQWDSGPCLWRERIVTEDTLISDGISKWVTLGENGAVSLRLNTSAYYSTKQDRAAAAGDYWPHLLLECPDFGYSSMSEDEKKFCGCSAEKLTLSLDLTMKRYSVCVNPKDWVEADQFLLYFYVKSKTGNDFVWFGVQLFDSRFRCGDDYCALDGGKADASGRLIYSVGLTDVFEASDGSFWGEKGPAASENAVHIELDLKKALKKMIERGLAMDYFSPDVHSLEDLYINGMNVGFETIGTFDTEFSISGLSLISEITT